MNQQDWTEGNYTFRYNKVIQAQPNKKFLEFPSTLKVSSSISELEVYGHIVENRYNKKVSKLRLYFTGERNGNPYIDHEMKRSSVNTTIGEFDRIVDNIEKRKFDIKVRPVKFCKNCDMKSYCDSR